MGWRKDLEYVLKVYYKHNARASYKEAEWVRTRDLFFAHLLLHKEEALDLKERSPMDFMPFIVEQFWRATGLHLNGRHGSSRGAIITDWWLNRATSIGAPT